MTQDEIIEMARQADELSAAKVDWDYEWVVCFAKLVAAKEREACAKEADKRLHDFTMLTSNPPQSGAAWSIAQAIRSRGEA
jgi:hypothetical protein